MAIFASVFLLLSGLLLAAGQDECSPARCNSTGPEIRFPFYLKNRQPDRCGFPGFSLSCSGDGAAVFELQYPITAVKNNAVIPFRAKVEIHEIDYKSQVIIISYIKALNCLPLKAPAVSSTAIQFTAVNGPVGGINTLFNCSASSNGTEYDSDAINGKLVPCLSSPGYRIRSFESRNPMGEYILSSCAKMYDVSYVPLAVYSGEERFAPFQYIHLGWSDPSCGHCETQEKNCRPDNNGTVGGTHCVGNDIPKQPVNGKADKRPMIAGVTVGVCVGVIILVVSCIILARIEKRKREKKKVELHLESYRDMRPIRFSYSDLKKMTNQFKHKLGRGGYGTVFKGKLSEDILVAVKVLNSIKGNGEEFINEVGTIGKIHHINVVRLVGFCADGFRRALVYEFLPNDSLGKFISPGKMGKSLPWEKLREIAIGIAKGLDYLHQGCNKRILHFDIKPQNILLDHHFSPKVADFGLAKLCSKEQSIVSMTAARGTVGYIAPEVFSRNYGNVSYKSDVYSFGMLLLDMVGGRRNFPGNAGAGDSSQIYYPEWMYSQLEKREDIAIQIDGEDNRITFKKMAVVGLWCIQWYPADRPSMKSVIQMLEGESLPMIPPNPFASSDSGNVNAKSASFLSSELDSVVEENDNIGEDKPLLVL